MSSTSPAVPPMQADGNCVPADNLGMPTTISPSSSCRSSLSDSSIEDVMLINADGEEENVVDEQSPKSADDNRVDQMLEESLKKVATLTVERDAFAEELRDRQTELADERKKMVKIFAERDVFAEELAEEREKMAKIVAERDAFAGELRDRETQWAEECEKVETLTTERDASAEQLADERKKMAQIVVERDAFAAELRDRETQWAKECQKVETLTTERDASAEQLADERKKMAKLAAEKDAFAAELSDRQTKLAEEREKMAKIATERDASAEQLVEERKKMAKIVAERDAFAKELRDREMNILQLNNELPKMYKQLVDTQKQLEDLSFIKWTTHSLEVAKMEMKSSGQILFRMPNFKAFAEGRGPQRVFGDPAVYINGFPWRINIEYNNEWIGLFLNCDDGTNDLAWQCRTSFKLGVISFAKGYGCFFIELVNIFSAADNNWGWHKFAKIEELMDPKMGFYDAEGDTITFKAEVIVKELRGMAGFHTKHTLLVNGKELHVNKYLLAANSEFFQNLFFGPNADPTPKVLLEDDDEHAVAHFERLISTMYPINLALDDNCVEYVLCLAHKFQLESVVKHCVDFLLTSSKKSAIVKFGLAHQCEIVGMKKKVLTNMTKDDFDVAGVNFMDNFLEYNKLGAEAMQELRKRHTELLCTSY